MYSSFFIFKFYIINDLTLVSFYARFHFKFEINQYIRTDKFFKKLYGNKVSKKTGKIYKRDIQINMSRTN